MREERQASIRQLESFVDRFSIHGRRMITSCIVPTGGNHCDFCRASPIVRLYPCANFAIKGSPVFPLGLAIGAWAACKCCAEMVDRERWSELTDRAWKKLAKRHRISPNQMPEVREQLERVYLAFAEHRMRVYEAQRRG